MVAADIMTENYATVGQHTSLRDAAMLMGEEGIEVLVVTRGDRVVGTLSSRDLAVQGYGNGCEAQTPIARVMTTRLRRCAADIDLGTALSRMTEEGLEALLVEAASHQVLGLLPRVRVLEALAYPDDQPRGPTPDDVKQVRGEAS